MSSRFLARTAYVTGRWGAQGKLVVSDFDWRVPEGPGMADRSGALSRREELTLGASVEQAESLARQAALSFLSAWYSEFTKLA